MSRCPTVKAGKALPELSKPAGAAQIVSGYQALDQDGEIITGTDNSVHKPVISVKVYSSGGQNGSSIQVAYTNTNGNIQVFTLGKGGSKTVSLLPGTIMAASCVDYRCGILVSDTDTGAGIGRTGIGYGGYTSMWVLTGDRNITLGV